MVTEYYKFIKVAKQGQEYYYNCPNFFSPSSDCFNYFRADLNRVLLNSLPTQYTVIDCNSVTTVPVTTTPVTTIPSTTSLSTTSATIPASTTTLKPCDIGFISANFVNNATFPYDYDLQQGYIQIVLKNSSYSRNYQFRVTSGFNIIKDWTSPVQQMTVAFKLNCANYRILVRDYNDINCEAEILNISIPCLTSTTLPTTTVSVTTSSTTVPITTTSTTTRFQYAPCAIYFEIGNKILYKDIISNVEKQLVSDANIVTGLSLYNGILYLYSGFDSNVNIYKLQTISLSTLSKSFKEIVGINVGTNILATSTCFDSLGNYYLSDGDVSKYITSGDKFIFNKKLIQYKYDNGTYTNRGGMIYIANLDAFAMGMYISGNFSMMLIKADGSNLVLNQIDISYPVQSRSLFTHNNTLYQAENGYNIKYDLENNTSSKDYNIVFNNTGGSQIIGATQNSNCATISYNNQFKFGTMTYTCVNIGVFNLKFDILNGGGQYEYSTNNIGFSPISGTRFDFDFPISVDMIYINDLNSGKSYKFRRDPSVVCNNGFTTTIPSTTTVACVPLSSVTITGTTNTTFDSTTTHTVGTYNGSIITNYFWEVQGGTIVGLDNSSSVDVNWNEGVTNGRVTVNVTNCAGTKRYFRTITIS